MVLEHARGLHIYRTENQTILEHADSPFGFDIHLGITVDGVFAKGQSRAHFAIYAIFFPFCWHPVHGAPCQSTARIRFRVRNGTNRMGIEGITLLIRYLGHRLNGMAKTVFAAAFAVMFTFMFVVVFMFAVVFFACR
jgi:hypothetical protein